MDKSKGQNYMLGAAILTVGVVIMKILGFIYKVPIGNIIGDDGYSMFLATYNVYNVFLTLATAGLPIALSRMIAEARSQHRQAEVQRTFSVAWWTLFVVGLVCSLIMLLFPRQIAGGILHNPDAALSIRVMSPSVLLVCLVSAYRGYCQGHDNMIPTTVGQVLEVLVKVVVGLVLAGVLVRAGRGKPVGSAGAIFGVTTGSLAALIYMAVYKARNYRDDPQPIDTPDSYGSILKRFLKIGIPIALGSSVMSLLNLVDSGLCMGRLQSAARFPFEEAKVLYGVYGKAQTLFNMPAAFITPLTISVVPAVSGALARRENREATKISEDSMRIASALAMPMGVGLAVLARPIMSTIYPGSHPAGPALLAMMGIASIFVCLVLMESAVLQASGHEKLPMIAMICGGVVKVAVNYFLVARRDINIYGAPIGTLLSYFVMAAMNYAFMCHTLEKAPRLGAMVGRPLLCSAAMGVTAWGLFALLERLLGRGWLHMAIAMAVAMVAAVVVYGVTAILSRCITREDMAMIPGGGKLAKLLRMR